ncbi:translesion DNA synthesis-associated protein ImuA [Caenimonas sedimenti]|uniref:translesion DNA synthesis-associated protein ImuA n=1 Tax=Caenimonas sedimenti TaxID=2596921 RepID=UPI0021058E40|nr:translesion DNA synthesis-associated protein ImuA [Caenimonas sedimenti]
MWSSDDFAVQEAVVATGHPRLDAQLPGGGWPVGSLVEILQSQPAQHAWQLLLPALSQASRQQVGPTVLVGAPYQPFGPALQGQGLPAERLLWVKAEKGAARLWATEQALRCADVVAVLAWLPQARSPELRRLHLAAHQHGKLLFVFRGLQSRQEASPARLRLQVVGTLDMQVEVFKRQGPPLQEPISLPAHPARLAALLAARKRRTVPAPPTPIRSHGLDRTLTLAG